jgi:lipid A 3-O-deacylase
MRLLRFPRVGFLATLLFFFCVCGKAYALDSVVVELGSIEGDEEAERYGGAFRYAPETKWLESGSWYLSSYFEFGVTYWDGELGTEGEDSLVDFSLTPILRYQRSTSSGTIAPFFELGTGVHAHTETGIGDKDIDIPFSFGTHFGAGVRFGDTGRYELVYRFQHLSNAGLGNENPGLNFHVVQLGYHF